MAVGHIYVLAFFTALVAVNLIFAEESSLEQDSQFFEEVDVSAEAAREERSPNENEGQNRLFFGLSSLTTSCNYTTQAGSTCSSCTQALRCLSNNVGYLRNCRGFLPYCNNGYCSFLPGAACTASG